MCVACVAISLLFTILTTYAINNSLVVLLICCVDKQACVPHHKYCKVECCNFGALLDEMLHDRLVVWINDAALQRLL